MQGDCGGGALGPLTGVSASIYGAFAGVDAVLEGVADLEELIDCEAVGEVGLEVFAESEAGATGLGADQADEVAVADGSAGVLLDGVLGTVEAAKKALGGSWVFLAGVVTLEFGLVCGEALGDGMIGDKKVSFEDLDD